MSQESFCNVRQQRRQENNETLDSGRSLFRCKWRVSSHQSLYLWVRCPTSWGVFERQGWAESVAQKSSDLACASSLVSFWPCVDVGTTEWFDFHFSLSCIGEGNGNPLQCSCLENPRDWGAWLPAVYGISLTQLSSSSGCRQEAKRKELVLVTVGDSGFGSSELVCMCVCVYMCTSCARRWS